MGTIEELIKLPKFPNQKQKAIVSIYCINSLVVKYFEDVLAQYQLTFQQFNVLRILRGQHPNAVSVNVVKERMMDRSSDVSRLVARLVKAGLVTNSPNKEDKRVADIKISPAGLEVLKETDKREPEFLNLVSGLDDVEAEQLNALLQKFLDVLVKQTSV